MALRPRLVTSQPTPTKLDDFPEFVEERERLRSIANEYNLHEGALRAAEGSLKRLSALVAKEIDESACALVENRQAPIRATLTADREQLDFHVKTLRRALALQAERLEEVQARCVEELLAIWRPEHQRIMQRILDTAVAVGEALDADQDFRLAARAAGLNDSAFPQIGLRLTNAVGSRRHWASAINALGRQASAYLGRQWDHSPVTH
jgi:hypothetical protein